MVADSRPDAGGVLGASSVARRPAGGYTLFVGSPGSGAISLVMRKGLNYDPIRNFEPIAPITVLPLVITVSAESSAEDLATLIRITRGDPDAANYVFSGGGSLQHPVMATLASRAGVRAGVRPERGVAFRPC